MDKEALNIIPSNIKRRVCLHNYNYTFLDKILNIDIETYYNLVSSIELFKIKNLYNFLFLRSLKLNTKFSTRKMKIEKYINEPDKLNNILKNYISNDKLYSIIIINGKSKIGTPLGTKSSKYLIPCFTNPTTVTPIKIIAARANVTMM